MPGRPAITPQNNGATTPSDRFSARDSSAARPTPGASRRSGSRPTIRATASRASARLRAARRDGAGHGRRGCAGPAACSWRALHQPAARDGSACRRQCIPTASAPPVTASARAVPMAAAGSGHRGRTDHPFQDSDRTPDRHGRMRQPAVQPRGLAQSASASSATRSAAAVAPGCSRPCPIKPSLSACADAARRRPGWAAAVRRGERDHGRSAMALPAHRAVPA